LPEITAFVFNRYDDFALKMKVNHQCDNYKTDSDHEQFSDYEYFSVVKETVTTEASYLVLSF
jgi:hypothetical protein